jgi:hypothetical protein
VFSRILAHHEAIMKNFLATFALGIYGTLSGFDRIRFRGLQRHLVYPKGLDDYLWKTNGILKDIKAHATHTTERIWHNIEQHAKQQKLDIHSVRNAWQSKEKLAAELARKGAVTTDSSRFSVRSSRARPLRDQEHRGIPVLRTENSNCKQIVRQLS